MFVFDLGLTQKYWDIAVPKDLLIDPFLYDSTTEDTKTNAE